MVSPACEVKGGAGAYSATTNGVNVTPGQTITIHLIDTSADSWSISCLSTDELSVAATVTASLTINTTLRTATFTAPVAGRAYRFRSVVNGGVNAQGVVSSSYSTTFCIYTLVSGNRVVAADETTEGNSTFGYLSSLNAFVRSPGAFATPSGTGFVSVTSGVLDAASIKVNLASGTYVTGTLAAGNGGTGITSLGTGVATWLGTPSGANLASALSTALPDTKGGTGLTSLGSGVATFLGTPSGANLASALTTALPVSKGGTGLTAVGTSLQLLRTNSGASGLEFTSLSSAIPASRLTALDANHLHAWELTETSGNFADTGSGTLVTLTANGTPIYATPGLLGNCPLFGLDSAGAAATTNATVLNSAFSDLPSTNVTLECWYKSFSATTLNHIVGTEISGASQFNIAGSGSTGNLTGTVQATGFKTPAGISTLTASQMNWHHVGLVYDNATGFCWLYLDGEVIGKATGQTGAVTWSTGTTPTFCVGKGLSTSQFTGQISRVRMSNIARGQAYFRTVYQTAMGY